MEAAEAKHSQEYYYSEGNTAYANNCYDRAIELYSNGLQTMVGVTNEITIKLLLNRAQCGLQLRDYDITIQDCSSVLKLDSCNCKALLRRATAYQNSGALSKAFDDVAAVVALPLDVQGNFSKIAVKEYGRLKHLIERDAIVMRREGRPAGMVTREQVIRLFIFEPPPSKVTLNEPFSLKLCAGNEFGLWDRNLMLVEDSTDVTRNQTIDPIYELIIPGCADFLVISSFSAQLRLELCEEKSRVVKFTEDGKLDITCKIASGGMDLTHSKSPFSIPIMIKASLSQALPSGATVMPVITMPILLSIPCRELCDSSASTSLVEHVDDSQCDVSTNDWSQLLGIGSSLAPSCIRLAAAGGQSVMALECPGFLGIGGKVWDSTFVLLNYLSRYQELIRSKKVAELGSGTGLAGIGLSTLNPQSVILTDMADVVPLLRANIALNGYTSRSSTVRACLSSFFSAEQLFWGEPPSLEVLASDVIVASDVVYDPIGYEPLIETIFTILTTPITNTEVRGDSSGPIDPDQQDSASDGIVANRRLCILAHRHRHPEDEKFFASLRSRSSLLVQQIDFQQKLSSSRDLLDVEIYHIYLR